MSDLKVLMIDDLRPLEDCPNGVIARTYDKGIELLEQGDWDILYLDHDLGDIDPHKTGYGICKWIEANPKKRPGMIVVITSNIVGRDNMAAILTRYYELGSGPPKRNWYRKEIIPT